MTNQVNYNKQDNKAKIIEAPMSFPMEESVKKILYGTFPSNRGSTVSMNEK